MLQKKWWMALGLVALLGAWMLPAAVSYDGDCEKDEEGQLLADHHEDGEEEEGDEEGKLFADHHEDGEEGDEEEGEEGELFADHHEDGEEGDEEEGELFLAVCEKCGEEDCTCGEGEEGEEAELLAVCEKCGEEDCTCGEGEEGDAEASELVLMS